MAEHMEPFVWYYTNQTFSKWYTLSMKLAKEADITEIIVTQGGGAHTCLFNR